MTFDLPTFIFILLIVIFMILVIKVSSKENDHPTTLAMIKLIGVAAATPICIESNSIKLVKSMLEFGIKIRAVEMVKRFRQGGSVEDIAEIWGVTVVEAQAILDKYNN